MSKKALAPIPPMLQVDCAAIFSDAVSPDVICVAPEQLESALAFYSSFFKLEKWDAHSAHFKLPGKGRVLLVETSLDDAMPTSLALCVKDVPKFFEALSSVLSLDEMSLQLQSAGYYLEQSDPFDVTWQLTWPEQFASLEVVRRFASENAFFIDRRKPEMPTRWGNFCEPAGVFEGFDVEQAVERWGLPQFEEYGAPSQAPEYKWMHKLGDGTFALFNYDTETTLCTLYVDPGDPTSVLSELGCEPDQWHLTTDAAWVRDDDGETTGTWRVMRQDESGNAFEIRGKMTAYEASRWVLVFEARGHKQVYWAEESAD